MGTYQADLFDKATDLTADLLRRLHDPRTDVLLAKDTVLYAATLNRLRANLVGIRACRELRTVAEKQGLAFPLAPMLWYARIPDVLLCVQPDCGAVNAMPSAPGGLLQRRRGGTRVCDACQKPVEGRTLVTAHFAYGPILVGLNVEQGCLPR